MLSRVHRDLWVQLHPRWFQPLLIEQWPPIQQEMSSDCNALESWNCQGAKQGRIQTYKSTHRLQQGPRIFQYRRNQYLHRDYPPHPSDLKTGPWKTKTGSWNWPETTRFVDVPIKVQVPPNMEAKLKGMYNWEVGSTQGGQNKGPVLVQEADLLSEPRIWQ